MSELTAYYGRLASAFVRGKAAGGVTLGLRDELAERELNELTGEDCQMLIAAGRAAGLRVHKFKRSPPLRRVSRVLGILRGTGPGELLDIGSGRGTFLWPLLDAMPYLKVTAIDRRVDRAADIHAVRLGGLAGLQAAAMDATHLAFAARSFDVVTCLEVLEHIPDAPAALAEAVRVARRFVIVSAPSKSDDNPEHIHLFTRESMKDMFAAAGVERVNFEYVLNHLIAVATVEQP